MRIIRWVGLAALLFARAEPAAAQTAYSFDAAHSSLEINVYKEGFFKAFGHEHLVTAKDFSGAARFDADKLENSTVTLRVAAKSFTVVDPGESDKDRQQVQATMLGESVLDTARYPEIIFRSTGVTKLERQGDGWRLTLTGTLLLHGAERPVTFPLTVRVSGGELTAQGEVFFLQTDYGIKPVKVGGGAVKVKDRLRIHFEIHAHASAGP